MWRWIGGVLALGVAGCASYGGTRSTYEVLSSMPLTQLVAGGDGVTRVAPGIVWHIWNDLNDPASRLSVESKIRRAALNSSGYVCQNYGARGDHLTKGWFYELGSMATGAQTTPNGGCVSDTRQPPEVFAEIRMLGGASVDAVAAAAMQVGFACPPAVDGVLNCSADYIERETLRQPPEVVANGGKAVTKIDHLQVVVLTYSPGQPASVAMTRTIVAEE